MKFTNTHKCFRFVAALALTSGLAITAQATDISRVQLITGNLTDTGAWDQSSGGTGPSGGPGSDQIALYTGALTSARNNNIGGNLTWLGIRVTNNMTATQTIGSTPTTATLHLGSSGIDMSDAGGNLTISAVTSFDADQTFTIASGRVLTMGSVQNTGGTGNLTITGSGGTFLLGQSNVLGNGSLTLNNGIIVGSSAASGRTVSNAIILNGNITVLSTQPSQNTGAWLLNGNVNLNGANRTISLSSTSGTDIIPTLGFNTGSSVTGGVLRFENVSPGTAAMQSVYLAGPGTPNWTNVGLSLGSGVTGQIANTNMLSNTVSIQLDSGSVLQLAKAASTTTWGASQITQTVGSLNGAGTITSNSTTGTGTFTVNSAALNVDSNFSGAIINAGTGATISLAKAGAGNYLNFSGTNTYNGSTTVTSGTLLISGGGSINNTTGVTVANGGTFGYGSSVAMTQNVTVQDGGTLRAGFDVTPTSSIFTSSGALTMGSSTANNTIIEFALGAGGTHSTLARTGGTWVFDNTQKISFSNIGGATAGTYSGLVTGLAGDVVGGASTWAISSASQLAGYSGSFSWNGATSSIDLILTTVPVPEPSTWTLLGIGGLALILLHRRRRA